MHREARTPRRGPPVQLDGEQPLVVFLTVRLPLVVRVAFELEISGIRFDDLQFERDPYDKWQAYGQSKTANSLFAVQLDALGQDEGVRAFAVHPGGIVTPLQRHLSREEMRAAGWIDDDDNMIGEFKTPEQGAATTPWAATSPQLEGKGGVYCRTATSPTSSRPSSPAVAA